MAAGHSKNPLVQKLGIKEGHKILILNPPPNYRQILGNLPGNVRFPSALKNGSLDFVHFFAKERADLEVQFPALKGALSFNATLWISWPKGSSKLETDLSEGIVRAIGLRNGLVDIKVCAVNEVWSGLKFVYRLKDRKRRGI